MRLDTMLRVGSVLKATDYPLTVQEIAEIAELSQNSVRAALPKLNATTDGNHPARWTKYKKTKAPSLAGRKKETVAVALDTAGNWIARWDAARQRVGSTLATTAIRPDSDPQELLVLFTDASRVFASIAYALQQVRDKPDWYQTMGGDIETTYNDEDKVS